MFSLILLQWLNYRYFSAIDVSSPLSGVPNHPLGIWPGQNKNIKFKYIHELYFLTNIDGDDISDLDAENMLVFKLIWVL